MIFGFFPFLFLPLFPILRYVSGHCPAIHSSHLFIVHLLAWLFCIQLSFLFSLTLLSVFIFCSVSHSTSDFASVWLPFCLCISSSFFSSLVLVFPWFPCLLGEGRVSASISCHSGPSSYRILCSLFLRSQLFKFLRNIKEFSFTELCSVTSQENVICCHCWIHWKSSTSCSRGMPHIS